MVKISKKYTNIIFVILFYSFTSSIIKRYKNVRRGIKLYKGHKTKIYFKISLKKFSLL